MSDHNPALNDAHAHARKLVDALGLAANLPLEATRLALQEARNLTAIIQGRLHQAIIDAEVASRKADQP